MHQQVDQHRGPSHQPYIVFELSLLQPGVQSFDSRRTDLYPDAHGCILLDSCNRNIDGEIHLSAHGGHPKFPIPFVAIGRAFQPFPCPKRSMRFSPHSAFQLGQYTQRERTRSHLRRGAPATMDRHLLSPLHPFVLFSASIMASATPFCFCTTQKYLDVRFISSLPVMRRPACMAWADKRRVQIVWAEG